MASDQRDQLDQSIKCYSILAQLYLSVLLAFATNYACTPLFFELAAEVGNKFFFKKIDLRTPYLFSFRTDTVRILSHS